MTGLFLVAVFIFVPVNTTSAQSSKKCPKIRNQRARQTYEMAISLLKSNQRDAYDLLLNVIDMEPAYYPAYFELGLINDEKATEISGTALAESQSVRLDSYNKNIERYFRKVIELCPAYFDFEAFYFLGDYYFRNRNYVNAEKYMLQFVSFKPKSDAHKKEAASVLRYTQKYFEILNNPVPFSPYSIVGICTADDEYLPLLAPDGEKMYYTIRSRSDIRYSLNAKPVERFVYSNRLSPPDAVRDTFSFRIYMPPPFNEGKMQGGATITIDNKHLYITICQYERIGSTSYKNCDIYTTDFENNSWTQLRKLNSNINSNSTFEGQPSITADGNVLFFVSARQESIGKLDIYKSIKNKEGIWGKAQNLGETINTEGDEKTPFIHSDSRTLYFASDGHVGMGGLDIFYSVYETASDVDSFYTQYSFGKWTETKNIGYPINTANHEFGFIVSADGTKIYFSSNAVEGGQGGYDIFSSELYETARPKKILFLKGTVYDDEGHTEKNATIELKSIKTKKITEGLIDKTTGQYAVAVPIQKDEDFIITARKAGSIYRSQYVNPNIDNFEIPTIVDLEIVPIEKGKVVILDDVNFATNSTVLTAISMVILEDLILFLNENPNIHIELHGHTDNVGTVEHNYSLSYRRAKVVHDHLVANGISSERLNYKGYGEAKPVSTNSTAEGRSRNRRTEFVIVKK